MNFSATDRIAEALAKAEEHWRQPHDETKPTGFTIAMSREAGTFGAAIAHEVGRRLKWQVYDAELMQRVADDMGVRKSLLERVDERQPGWLEEAVSGLVDVPAVSEFAYYRRLLEVILSLAKIGNCVIVGRGGVRVLPMATTLRVRVVAPLEHRVAAVAKEHGVPHKAAAARVAKTDRERNKFVKEHFNVDATDPAEYDLVINAARFTVAEAAELIIEALDQLRAKPIPKDVPKLAAAVG